MIWVVDSGATKATWLGEPLPGSDTPLEYATEGLNPNSTPERRLAAAMSSWRSWAEAQGCDPEAAELHFYGAGCGSQQARQRMARLLHTHSGAAHCEVQSDLLGACRALAGTRPAVVAIVGTGSNACRYDGAAIAQAVPSLGYILGDEGSGCAIGHQLLHDRLVGRMPAPLAAHFDRRYPLSKAEVLEAVYTRPAANRYMASFAPFAAAHRQHPYMSQLLKAQFDAFVEVQLAPLRRGAATEPLRAAGSVAEAFQPELQYAAARHGWDLELVVANPASRLLAFHQGQAKF